jgi:DNA-binding CsgD family transcriptional regulator
MKTGSAKFLFLQWAAYGLLAGVLAAGMAWTKYRLLIADHATEVYGLVVATLFIILGIWLGLRLSKPKTIIQKETIVEEKIIVKEVQVTSAEFDKVAGEKLGLSAREMDVLHLLCKGHSNAEIAAELFVSANTVKTHVSNLLFKLDVKSRTKAADRARALGLLDAKPSPERMIST